MSRTQFWTILIGTEPTSFRARDKDTLLPTLKQLQRRHPEAVIKWYDRGELFDSPEAALDARSETRRERRPKDWRPGGEHRDPRAKYEISRDERRRRFKERLRADGFDGSRSPETARRRDTDRASRRQPDPLNREGRPSDDRPFGKSRDRKPAHDARHDRPGPPHPPFRDDKPFGTRPPGNARDRKPAHDARHDRPGPPHPPFRDDKPFGTRPPGNARDRKPAHDARHDRPGPPRPPFRDDKPFGTRPPGNARDRKPAHDARHDRPGPPRPPFRDDKPFGTRPPGNARDRKPAHDARHDRPGPPRPPFRDDKPFDTRPPGSARDRKPAHDARHDRPGPPRPPFRDDKRSDTRPTANARDRKPPQGARGSQRVVSERREPHDDRQRPFRPIDSKSHGRRPGPGAPRHRGPKKPREE